jgi:2-aminoadipate transaminase
MSSGFNPSQRAAWAEGQPISELMARALASPDLISLAAGFVDQETLPVEETREALDALLSDESSARAALQYGTTPGYLPLRECLLERFLASNAGSERAGDWAIDCGSLSPRQVVVTAGSNQLLHLVAESLLDPGDLVLCAAPTYLVFLGTLNNLGARSLGIASDEQGMIPEALDETLARLENEGQLPRVKLIYLVPYYDNPSGATMPAGRRAEVVRLARKWSRGHRIHVIADCAYRELRYSGADEPSVRCFDEQGDTVIVAGTFSKSYSPGIRVGWGILPPDLVEPVCNQKGNIDFGSPNFSQHLMEKVLRLGLFDRHVERLQRGYRQKLDCMLEAADQFLGPLEGVHWMRPTGGLYVWLHLPPTMDTGPSGRLFDIAVREGVLYVPGQFCYPREGQQARSNTIRLSFGVQSCDGIRRGVEALARAVAEVARS